MIKLTDREVREKLVSRGVKSLSDEELLSIIVGEGTHADSALDTAEGLLGKFDNSLLSLSKADIPRLRMTEGIGIKRASVLASVFEIADRVRKQEALIPQTIRNKEDVAAIFEPFIGQLEHEEMWALYLTSANGVIEKAKVSQGGVTSLIVDYKLIVKRAVEVLASSLIIVHNHPSGIASPSSEDIAITNRIAEAAALFDIMLVDHMIIVDGASYSFRQQGLIK